MRTGADPGIMRTLDGIEERAEAVGLNKASLCALADVSVATFNRWRAGTVSPTVKKINALERVIDRSTNLIEQKRA